MTEQPTNAINPEKLLLSKWTATKPCNKEKHFFVTRFIRNEQEAIVECILEVVVSHREFALDWHLLKDASSWLQGKSALTALN
ncbi:MAG: TIGR02450 family Trp-rich protein [Methylococcales bacterium]|nr:TIGR02450 family Trp-rich protein [Methylococcales bacterium]MDD5633011.1 TIGR02450 family Trp-rich protein [Methylococcales bacterium]